MIDPKILEDYVKAVRETRLEEKAKARSFVGKPHCVHGNIWNVCLLCRKVGIR